MAVNILRVSSVRFSATLCCCDIFVSFQSYKADVPEPTKTRRLTLDIGNLDDVMETDELETLSSLSSCSAQVS